MIIDSTLQTALAKSAISSAWLLWISAKNRQTGAIEAGGLWTGLQNQIINVQGVNRTYYGAGSFLNVPDIQYEIGTNVQTQTVSLSGINPKVIEMIREYDSRLARAELHLAVLDPNSEAVIGVTRAYAGWIDEIKINEGDGSTVSLSLASNSRSGTKSLPLKKSDAAQRLRDINDKGREYSSIAGSVPVTWGVQDGKMDVEISRPGGFHRRTIKSMFSSSER